MTCVSMNCPFIPYCKDYNFLVDRNPKCQTQEKILLAAKHLQATKRAKDGKFKENQGKEKE